MRKEIFSLSIRPCVVSVIVLKEDLLKCDQYSEQAKLLSKYHVNTDEDLSQLMKRIGQRLSGAASERTELKNKTRRVLPQAEIDHARQEMFDKTSEIRDLRREVKVCHQIQERSGHVRENLEIIERDRQREKAR